MEELTTVINPLEHSHEYGIDVYVECLQFVGVELLKIVPILCIVAVLCTNTFSVDNLNTGIHTSQSIIRIHCARCSGTCNVVSFYYYTAAIKLNEKDIGGAKHNQSHCATTRQR